MNVIIKHYFIAYFQHFSKEVLDAIFSKDLSFFSNHPQQVKYVLILSGTYYYGPVELLGNDFF
ncbi:MAG: hypothetical protein ACTHJ7_03875 [Candidatus Nitrosocosmicus sp.]